MICVLPGCRNTVQAEGDTCDECVAAFGNWLHPPPTRHTAPEIRASDEYVERAYHTRRNP